MEASFREDAQSSVDAVGARIGIDVDVNVN